MCKLVWTCLKLCIWTRSWWDIGVSGKGVGQEGQEWLRENSEDKTHQQRRHSALLHLCFGESLHGEFTGAKVDDACIGCQWCISSSLAEGKRGGFSTQLGESGSKWHQPDVLATSPARSTQCSYEVERPLDTVAGGAELCPYARNYLLTSWTRNFHFCSHWWFAFGGKQGRHRGDLQQTFREVDAEEKWTFWCKPHCVRWETLGVTWCKPRTWRCTTQKLNISPLLWLGGIVLMKGVMENLMRLSSTVTAIGQVAGWRENRRHQVSSSWTHAVCTVGVVHRCQFPSPQWKLKFLQPRVCWWKIFSWNNYFNSFLETKVDWATMLKCKWDCDWIQQVPKVSSIDLDLV